MALTSDGVERAEVTHCFETDVARDSTGAMVPVQRRLPWVFVRFGSVGEERYVAPVGGVGLALLGGELYRESVEYMSRRAFPYGVTSDGPTGVQFFGGA